MIQSLAILLGCQLAGEVLARLSGLPLPGPVIGMLLLLGMLLARPYDGAMLPKVIREGEMETIAAGLLANLSLLFVPAGVGVIQQLDVLGKHWLALALALVASSVLGIVVTALVFRWANRGRE